MDGALITEEVFVDLVADLERYEGVAPEQPSYFELLTAGALLWFSNEAVDAAVVEVGLLGRYDATNVIDSDVSVVTNIGRDHTDGTGDWRRDVASEKAGIIRAGRPLVLGETSIGLREVFAAEAPDPLLERGVDFGVRSTEQAVGGQMIELWTPAGEYAEVFLGMYGDHQADNAVVAVTAAEVFLGVPLGDDVMAEGFAAVQIPGRLEGVSADPLVVLDGAHNPEAVRTLAISVVCTAPSPRAVPAADLAALARSRRMDVEVVPDPVDAVRLAVSVADEADLVLVTGSFYVLSAAREALDSLDGP